MPEAGVCPAKRQSPADSANRGKVAQAGLSQAEGIQAAAPADRGKTGLRVAGGETGRCGVSPLERVAPHEVGAKGNAFPNGKTC